MNRIGKVSLRAALAVLYRLERRATSWKKIVEHRVQLSSAAHHLEIRHNAELRGRHHGRRAFVIGNGSSVAKQDLQPLRNEITFVMNGFWKHEAVGEWQPDYYCFADSVYFDGSHAMSEFFANLTRKVKESTFLVPVVARETILKQGLLPIKRTRFIAFGSEVSEAPAEAPDLAGLVPGVQSVSQLAIMAAMYTGCSPIYLLGMDHDWLAQRGMEKHFYAGLTIPGHDLAHGNMDRHSYASDLESVLKLFRGYESLARGATVNGLEIINATQGGFLDVFPRRDYASLFPLDAIVET